MSSPPTDGKIVREGVVEFPDGPACDTPPHLRGRALPPDKPVAWFVHDLGILMHEEHLRRWPASVHVINEADAPAPLMRALRSIRPGQHLRNGYGIYGSDQVVRTVEECQ